ncbi:Gfo/Idh/MocA family oxidoreductase [bacterium]|nr:Gfo/Idh/MocA family oxidoreductase [bacterium]
MVKVALLGYGYWGPNLARCLNESKSAELSYIIDLNETNRDKAKSRFPNAIVGDDLSLPLNDPDLQGIVIATPAKTHYDLAKMALSAGKDVLVEKPLALSLEEGEELVELAQRNGRILMVGHLMLYHPAVERIREMVKCREIGDSHYFFSQRLNLGKVRSDENVLWSLAPHDVSMLLYIFDEMPSSVCAHGGCFLQKAIEDIVFIHLDFPSGIMADIQVSWLSPLKIRRVLIVGEQKMLIFDDVEPLEKLKVYEHSIDIKGNAFMNTFTPRYGDIYSPVLPSTEPLRAECEEFIRCIQTREKPKTDGEEGLKVLKVLESAQRSLDTGERVFIN